MKRSLYPLVKHGARIVLVGVAVVVSFFIVVVAACKGNYVQAIQNMRGTQLLSFLKILLVVEALFITASVGSNEYQQARARRLSAAKEPAKLLTDGGDASQAG